MGICGVDEMLGQQSDMVGRDHNAIEDGSCLGDPPQSSEGCVIAGTDETVSERAVMYTSEEGLRGMDPCAGQVRGKGPEMPGLFDALQSFEVDPRQQVREGMLLPAVADLPETGVRLADAAHGQLRKMRQEPVKVSGAQINIPFVEEDRCTGQKHFVIGVVLHKVRGLMVAAHRCAAAVAGPIRMLRFRKGQFLAEGVHRPWTVGPWCA